LTIKAISLGLIDEKKRLNGECQTSLATTNVKASKVATTIILET
jgi:hypothetical protein